MESKENDMKKLREELGIDSWLELTKEDKNLDSAYVSFAQYMDYLEKSNTNLNELLNEIREYINSNCNFNGTALYDNWVPGKEILKIIDKVIGSDNSESK